MAKTFGDSEKSRTFALAIEKHRGVEQLVARWAHNPKVISSSLVSATKKEKFLLLFFLLYLYKNIFPNASLLHPTM